MGGISKTIEMPGEGVRKASSRTRDFGNLMSPDRVAKETMSHNNQKMDLVLGLFHLTLEGRQGISRGSLKKAEGIVDGILGPAENREIVLGAARDIFELASPDVADMLRKKVAEKKNNAAGEIERRYYEKLSVSVERALNGTE